MIGIEQIGSYLPETFRSNFDLQEKFNIDESFIVDKIGFKQTAKAGSDQQASDLCVYAYNNLLSKINLSDRKIGAIVVVTQNPDVNLPHVSAIVHGKLNLPEDCAAFDISLGCSGFVYGLSVLKSFMIANGINNAILFTADPYSKIIDDEDKNTSLLFGDGATATLLSTEPILTIGKFTFGTIGKLNEELICRDGKLHMNGRSIFNFAARYVPKDIQRVIEINNLDGPEDLDLIALHQGSKYIVDTVVKRLKIPIGKAPFVAGEYGNLVSSSIPFMLTTYIGDPDYKKIIISGFGVGLSWSSTVLNRK